MADDSLLDRVGRAINRAARKAGREYARSRSAYGRGRSEALANLPRDDEGRVRIVCRRFAERRALPLDADARPPCFDPDHPDCQGCVEDIRDGTVETWSP